MNTNKHKLVFLEWEDSFSINFDWNKLEDVLEWAKNDDCIIKQAGFVLDENDKYILLATQVNEQQNTPNKYSSFHKIPITWIRKRKGIIID